MNAPEPEGGPTAVLDACALVPIRLATTLLWLAEAGVFEVLWSDEVLSEVQRNLPKVGVTAERAARRVDMMREAFSSAAMVANLGHLILEMDCDPKDRHVLAAAVRGGADTLMTFNVKDFPAASAADHRIEVVRPDLFLARLLADRPGDVVAALERGSATLRNPPQSLGEFLASLTPTVPTFANLCADAAASPRLPAAPLAALISADEDEALAAFGETGDQTNPAWVALAWWTGVLNNLDLARVLTLDPSKWGDYQQVGTHLAEKSLASKVIPAVDAPQDVAFMRFIPEVSANAQVFSPSLATMTFLTLVKLSDGTWRVCDLGPSTPAAKGILDHDGFVAGGGTALVLEWLSRITDPEPPVELIWGALDQPLRLANAQAWLLNTGHVTADDPRRDDHAAKLSARDSTHVLFAEFYGWLVAHYQDVYRVLDGRPCLVEASETIGVDLELISVAPEDMVGPYQAGESLLAHAFITRHLGNSEWVIAANARRLPVPGWPPHRADHPRLAHPRELISLEGAETRSERRLPMVQGPRSWVHLGSDHRHSAPIPIPIPRGRTARASGDPVTSDYAAPVDDAGGGP